MPKLKYSVPFSQGYILRCGASKGDPAFAAIMGISCANGAGDRNFWHRDLHKRIEKMIIVPLLTAKIKYP
jgi:hypothetical protein